MARSGAASQDRQTGGARPRVVNPATNVARKMMIATQKSVFAIPEAVDAIPPNPKSAATSATMKKIRAHLSMVHPL
jgi:hypothetical protein